MILHILNRAPDNGQAAAQVLAAMAPDDQLVLIEEAVFAVLDTQWQGWHRLPARIHVLKEDTASRGLTAMAGHQALSLIDVHAFVALTAQAHNTVSWN